MKFVVFTDQKYSGLCSILLDSLQCFSQAEVTVYSLGFTFSNPHPKLLVIPFERCEGRSFWMERIYRLSQESGSFILLDADCVANWNVDQLFSLCNRGYPMMHQPGLHGQFYQVDLDYLQTTEAPIYVNTVPLVFSNGGSERLRQLWPWIEKFNTRNHEVHGAEIDDERALNFLRCATQENVVMSICGPDRHLFDHYVSCKFDGVAQKHRGVSVTWHTFHGEKDEAKARAMFETLLHHGSTFLYSNPWRNRVPQIYG